VNASLEASSGDEQFKSKSPKNKAVCQRGVIWSTMGCRCSNRIGRDVSPAIKPPHFMLHPVFAANQALRTRLSSLVQPRTVDTCVQEPSAFTITTAPGADTDSATPVHVVVTANEVNHLHGTGPLVQRIFKNRRNIFSIRARNDWGGHDFGDWNVCLRSRARGRSEAFTSVLSVLRGRHVASVLCVPYLPDELLTSIAIHECFGAKLCVYLMDDQNVASHNIPDALMREFLERCSLRLTTHPELRFAYQSKYGLPFHLLPAVVPAMLVPEEPTATPVFPPGCRRGALLGSFWDQSWFDRLCGVLSGCDFEIDWFGNNKSPWFEFSARSLKSAGITAHGVVPEAQLALELAKYPFVIVPVGALDEKDGNTGVAWLSLPGRILFALACSHTPILIVGSGRTCGARFVAHFDVGEVVPYDAVLVSAAVERLSRPEDQRRIRQNAARIAPALSDRGVADWLKQSIELGAPADRRFEDPFAGYDATIDLADGPKLCTAASQR
jgi:hypothetical protein